MSLSENHRFLVHGAAFLAVAIGAFSLFGWGLDLPLLKSVLPGAVEMKANTAAGVVLSGGALLLLVARPSPFGERLARALGLVVGGLGLATLAEYLFGWNLGIDELLFIDSGAVYTAAPGRMSPYSAGILVAIGLATAAQPLPKWRGPLRALMLVVFILSVFTIFGYLWDASEIVTDAILPPVAIHAAIAFLLLSAGLAYSTLKSKAPDDSRSTSTRRLKRATLIGFLFTLLTLVGGFGAVYQSVDRLSEAERRVRHTYRVIDDLEKLYTHLTDSEVAQRNYLLTGDRLFKDFYTRYASELRQSVRDVYSSITEDVRQTRRLQETEGLLEQRLNTLEWSTTRYEEEGLDSARRTIASDQGLGLMAAIRARLREMNDVELTRLNAREDAAAAERGRVLVALLIMLVMVAVVFAFLFYFVHREMGLRNESIAALRRLNAQFDKFFNLSLDMICFAGGDGYFKRVNPAFTQALGWSAEELLARPFVDFVHPDDRAATLREVERQIVAGENVLQFENRYLHKDGSWRTLSWSSTPDVDGLMFATARDVTEAKRVAAALRDREERLNAIVNTVADAIVTIDDKGTVQSFNPAAERIFGFDAAEAMGRNVNLLMPEPDRGAHDGYIGNYLKTGKAKVIGMGREVTGRRKDGSTFPMELTISEMRVADRRMFTGVVRDITERKRSEQALHAAMNEAQRATRAKSTFLATMSHEIRTPLNGIIANLELLGRTDLDDDQIDLLGDADRAGMALLALIGNILDFSKIEEGRFAFELGDVDIAALTEEAVNVLQSKARQKGVFISTAFAADTPRIVRCDGPRIRQILLNLIGNAVKFTERGGILVDLSVTAWDRDVCELRFTIHDSGKGFHQAGAAKLFEAFVQEGSNRPGSEGTGLGLSICRSLVENFGGTIECDGREDEGATFVFTLPTAVVRMAGPVDAPDLSKGKVSFLGGADGEARLLKDYFAARGATVEIVQDIDAVFSAGGDKATQERDAFHVVVFPAGYVDDHNPDCFPHLRERGHSALICGLESTFHNVRRSLRAGFPGLIRGDCSTDYLDRNIRRLIGQGRSYDRRLKDLAVPAGSDLPKFRGHERVLVLEDRLVNQTAIKKQLGALGLDCTIASNGRKGIDAYENGAFDAILCDCSMPEMDGFEFTREIRRREREAGDGRHVPIVALTANAFREDAERCFEAGMDDFMSKPVTLARMSIVLKKWLTPQGPVGIDRDRKLADPSGQAPAIDLRTLAENLGTDDKADIDEILAQFPAAAGDSLASVAEALSSGDAEKIADAAHGAKGEAQSAAAGDLAKIYAEMERRAKAGDLDGLKDLGAHAATELRRVEDFIRRRAGESTA